MKKRKIILFLIGILILMGGIVQATLQENVAEAYTIKMDLSSGTQLKRGDTFNVIVNIQDINVESGIVAFDTILEYDHEVFDVPTITSTTNWQEPIMVENLIQGVTASMESITQDQQLLNLTFQVKDDAKVGDTKISLKNFEVSDGENTIAHDDTEMQVEIIDNTVKTQDNVTIVKENNIGQFIIIVLLVVIIIIAIIMILFIIYLLKKYDAKILNEGGRTYIDRRKEDRRKIDRRKGDRRNNS